MRRDIVTSPELALADYLAQNAVAVLLSVTLVWLLITAAFWHVVHTYGATLWSLAVRTWRWWQECAFARGLARVPVIGPLFVRSITVLRYLGLHAVVSFTIAVLATTAFVELGDEIGIGESLAAFDAALAGALDRHVSPATLRVFAAITLLGDGAVLVPLAIGVTLVLAFFRRWTLTAAWAVATAGGGLLNLVLKQIFARARPPHAHGWVTETSYSFPSGHASGSMVVYGLLAYLIVRYTAPRWHVPVTMTMVALILFVGSSRVILQVHYFSDVLAGYASAAAWVALCITGLEVVSWQNGRSRADQTPALPDC